MFVGAGCPGSERGVRTGTSRRWNALRQVAIICRRQQSELVTPHDCLCGRWTATRSSERSSGWGRGTSQSIGAETAIPLNAPRNPLLTLKSAISAVVESHDIPYSSVLARSNSFCFSSPTKGSRQTLRNPPSTVASPSASLYTQLFTRTPGASPRRTLEDSTAAD